MGLLVLACAVPAASDARADDRFSVVADGNRLVVMAREAALADLLAAVARVTGITVAVDPAIGPRMSQATVSAAMAGVSADEALQRLLRDWNATFLYSLGGLAEVRVYGDGTAGTSPAAASRASGPTGSTRRTLTSEDVAAMRRADLQRRGLSHLLDPTRSFTEADVARAAAELEGSLDPTALQEALDTLSGAAAPPLDPLVRFAESRADSGLRSQALELLEPHRQDPRVTDLLQRLATRDPDESIRDDASRMLRVGNR